MDRSLVGAYKDLGKLEQTGTQGRGDTRNMLLPHLGSTFDLRIKRNTQSHFSPYRMLVLEHHWFELSINFTFFALFAFDIRHLMWYSVNFFSSPLYCW